MRWVSATKNLHSLRHVWIVQRQGTVISAALLAIAGSGALPFAEHCFRDLLSSGSAAANLAAFDESFRRAQSGGVEEYVPPRVEPFTLPVATNALGERWLPRIADLPEALHETAYHSINRLIDYQDEAYAEEGWSSLGCDRSRFRYGGRELRETGDTLHSGWRLRTFLALRSSRCDQIGAMIRSEVNAAPEQPVTVAEFFPEG